MKNIKTNVLVAMSVLVLSACTSTQTQIQQTDAPMPSATPEATQMSEQKLNIDVVCQESLAYMTFPDGKAADQFLIECKNGEHPDVIEQYKQRMNNGNSEAQI